MNYNPWIFWIRFAAVYVPYWRLGHRKQNALLLVSSYVFYGFWDYRFLFLILISTAIDFIGGLGLAGARPPTAPFPPPALLVPGRPVPSCTPPVSPPPPPSPPPPAPPPPPSTPPP